MSRAVVHPTRRQFIRGTVIVGAGAAAGGLLAACAGESGTTEASSTRERTLFVAGFQWGTPTTFNPLNPTVTWPNQQNGDVQSLIYETLFGFNLLDGSLEPLLAESLEEPDAATLTVALHPDAQWQDGEPVTADDVVYTFALPERHEEVWYASYLSYLPSVTKVDDRTVTFTLDAELPNARMAKTALAWVPILPQHVWEGIEAENPEIGEFTNTEPVGSGPYRLDSFNANQVVLTRHDDYWGQSARDGLPAPERIVHPIFKDNAAGNLAFERGEVDAMQQFTPQIWEMWEEKELPVGTWFDEPPYHLPGSIPMLVVNTTKPGLSDPRVRVALAHMIDYPRIADTAMSQYSDPVNSSLVLPRGAEGGYFDQGNVDANGWTHDPGRAARILEEELGATKGDDGVYVLPDGTRLGGFTVQTPTGWSDWQTAAEIVAEDATAAGIEVSTEFPQAPQVTTAVQNGDFDLAIWFISGTSPGTPWARFRDVLDGRGVPAVGESAFHNFGRFSSPDAEALLDQAAMATDDAVAGIYTQLDTIFMQNAPMIPLMYRPLHFYEYNESVWTGFPTAEDPTAPPTFNGAGVLWLWEISAGAGAAAAEG